MNTRIFVAFSCLVPLACSPASGDPPKADNGDHSGLVGGTKALGYDSVIWTKFLCTATRIGQKQVLTAAHCVSNVGPLTYWTQADISDDEGDAVLGEPRKNNIVSLASAPGNTGPNKPYDKGEPDFVVLELESELPSSVAIAPIDISPVAAGEGVTILGHGCDTHYGKQPKPTLLKALTLPVLSETESGAKVGDPVHAFYFMTKADDSQGICPGDSGGPVFRGSHVVGVNSFAMAGLTTPVSSGHSRLSIADTSFWTSRGITPIGTPDPKTPGSQPSDPGKNPTNGSGGSAGMGSGGTGGDVWGSGGSGGDWWGSGGSGGVPSSGGSGGDWWGSGGDGGSTSSAGSCYGYCGSSDPVPGSDPACYCDSSCSSNGDCCSDAWTCQ